MTQSTHYNLNLAEGTDLVNPLTIDVPNYQTIDGAMFANEQAGVGTATELKSGNIHAITRTNTNRDVFRFHSTSIYNAGDAFTVDGGSVTAVSVDGGSLKDRCFIIGSDVLCILNGSQLTVLATYVPETINASSVYPVEYSPSTHNYTVGDHLIKDGVTYSVIANISVGDSLTIGTNISVETLNTRFNTVENDVSDIENTLTMKSTSNFGTAFNNSKLFIVLEGNGTSGGNSVSLTLFIPKSAITATEKIFEIGDSYNGQNHLHLQAWLSTTGFRNVGFYDGASRIADETLTWYYI